MKKRDSGANIHRQVVGYRHGNTTYFISCHADSGPTMSALLHWHYNVSAVTVTLRRDCYRADTTRQLSRCHYTVSAITLTLRCHCCHADTRTSALSRWQSDVEVVQSVPVGRAMTTWPRHSVTTMCRQLTVIQSVYVRPRVDHTGPPCMRHWPARPHSAPPPARQIVVAAAISRALTGGLAPYYLEKIFSEV